MFFGGYLLPPYDTPFQRVFYSLNSVTNRGILYYRELANGITYVMLAILGLPEIESLSAPKPDIRIREFLQVQATERPLAPPGPSPLDILAASVDVLRQRAAAKNRRATNSARRFK